MANRLGGSFRGRDGPTASGLAPRGAVIRGRVARPVLGWAVGRERLLRAPVASRRRRPGATMPPPGWS